MLQCLPLLLYVDNSPSRLTQLRQEIPYLKAMGYQGICYSQFDESDEKASLFEEDFHFHNIEPSAITLNAPFAQQGDVFAQIQAFKDSYYLEQSQKYAKLYQGGLIVILSKKSPTNTVEQLASQLNQLSLYNKIEFHDISTSLPSDYKAKIRCFLEKHAPSFLYGETLSPRVLQQLQRVDHQFEVRQNEQTKQCDAVIKVKDIIDFEQRAIKIKRKLDVHCRFVMNGNSPLLLIPQVTDFETQKRIEKAQCSPTRSTAPFSIAKLNKYLATLAVLPNTKSAEIDFKDSITLATLVLPVGSEILLNGQKIIKLTLVSSLNIREYKSSYVIARSIQGVNTVFYDRDSFKLEKLFLRQGAYFEKTFHQFYHLVNNPDWKNTPTRDIYDASKRNFYALVHQKTATSIVSRISQSKRLFQTAKTQGVLVFSFGCGEGAELVTVRHTLAQEQMDAQCIGVDINPENFRRKFDGVTLIKGDMLETKQLIAPFMNNKKLKIGLFIGSLVQQCLSGTQQAATVLAQASQLDLIIITGYTNPFISKPMAKALGWQVSATNINHEVQEGPLALKKGGLPGMVGFYTLSRMNEVERKRYLIKRAVRRSSKAIFDCLDISLSDNPLRDLTLFEQDELAQLKLIDLSWCPLTQNDFHQLFCKIDELNIPSLKIIFSGNEPWLDYLVPTSLKGSYVFLERTDYLPSHVNPFTQSQARLLKLFKEPPYRNSKRFTQKPKKENEREVVCKKLETLINSLDEVKDNPPFDVTAPLTMTTLKFSGTSIKKATIFSVFEPSPLKMFDEHGWIYDPNKSCILIKLRNGERKQFRSKKTNELLNIEKTALSYGYLERALLQQLNQEFPWESRSTRFIYDNTPRISEFYQKHHQYIPLKIVAQVNAQDNLQTKAKKYGVSIFSFGCGDAQDLRSVKNLFVEQSFKCNNAIGIDVNPANFPVDKDKDLTLIPGKMQNISTHISSYIDQPDLKIGLFIGSLVDQCLPKGILEAVDILQQAKSMDMIFLSGVTSVLLLKWIAKGMGWHFSAGTTDIDMDESPAKIKEAKNTFTTYTLRAMNDEDRKKYLQKRGTKRTKANAFHCLDLSMSADPLRDLNLFSDNELSEIKQIDLSFSAMNEKELELLSIRICALNKPELIIIISKTESWLNKINVLKQFTFFAREDFAKESVPSVQPHIARALGVYSSLPGTKVKFR